jgi:hypothetical protein
VLLENLPLSNPCLPRPLLPSPAPLPRSLPSPPSQPNILTYPLDSAVAADQYLVLNAINDKLAFYTLTATNGNWTGDAPFVTKLSDLFAKVATGDDPATGFIRNWAWPSAIKDKAESRFLLACASNVQAYAGNKITYPAGGVGAVYIASSDYISPQTGDWQIWGMPIQGCAAGQYSLPDMVQVRPGRGRAGVGGEEGRGRAEAGSLCLGPRSSGRALPPPVCLSVNRPVPQPPQLLAPSPTPPAARPPTACLLARAPHLPPYPFR